VSAWLAAAYAVLALGLAWSLTGGTRWVRRIPFIVAAPVLGLALWLDRPNTAGWPSTAGPPAHAALVSAVVQEPDPVTADRGRIYLWLDLGTGEPRAYSVPYSRSAHEQVQRALSKLARRQRVELVSSRPGTRGGHGHGLRFAVQRLPRLPSKPGDEAQAAGGR
jgi:hypothetical protein